MISLFNNTKNQVADLADILSNCKSDDFYITENNQRVIVDNVDILKRMLYQSNNIYYINDYDTDRKGILLVWKSINNDITRNYVKFIAKDADSLRDLLTVFLWNYPNELYIKIDKQSKFLKTFYSKGFRFSGGRGNQVLLKKDKRIIPKVNIERKDFNEELNVI